MRIVAFLAVALVGILSNSTKLAAEAFLDSPPSYTQSKSLREDASLQAITFSPNGLRGLAVGDHGTILLSDDEGENWRTQPSGVTCGLTDVVWLSNLEAVVIGGQYDRITRIGRGVALWTNDGGKHWHPSSSQELPYLRSLQKRDEDNAVVAVADWSPVAESHEFETHDRGRSWESTGELDGAPELAPETKSSVRLAWVQSTGALTIVRDVAQTDTTWFAACDHGMILRGERGPKQWKTIRGDARRCSILVVAKTPSTVPWPLIGSEAMENRQRVSILVRDPVSPHTHVSPNRDASAIDLAIAKQAAANLAAASLDQIDPDGQNAQAIIAEAKNWIAIHRPSVVVLDHSLDRQTANAFSQVAITAGVPRVVRYTFAKGGDHAIHSSAMMTVAGALAGDLWEDALQLVAPMLSTEPILSLRFTYDSAGKPTRGESLTTGIPISSGQKLASGFAKANRRQLQVVQARLAEPRRIDQLIQGSPTTDAFAASLKQLLDHTANEDQLRLSWVIKKQVESLDMETSPQSLAFQESLLAELAERFAGHSYGKWASLRLEAIQRSSEWRNLRYLVGHTLAAQMTESATNPAVQQVAVSPFQIQASGIVQASGNSPLLVVDQTPLPLHRNRTKASSEVDLAWEFHPIMLIAGEAARLRGDEQTLQSTVASSGNFQRLSNSDSRNPWTNLLAVDGIQQVIAKSTTKPPKLDGVANERFWQDALATNGPTAPIQIAYDEKFVYLFVRCDRESFSDSQTIDSSSKNRDHDLRLSDRLKISIDTDRDFLTAFELQTTVSGKTHDAIDGQAAWQPTWYVAAKEQGDYVSFELAVLRRDLMELPIHTGQSWFLSAKTLAAGDSSARSPIADPRQWHSVTFR
ncbi:hypothetical protein CA13_42540 [Planctomycetes bacterium CA13]|uniref:Ycf48-like protein n=1 Tax=Novipirellula herctigrandis TaxID=2527986 RepID=A0A5C5Z7J2_9BACT|nr:hypothetical protein CA13_42540 [Planctomycetes bacterium CA13]